MKHAPSLESNTTCCELVGNAGPDPIRVPSLHPVVGWLTARYVFIGMLREIEYRVRSTEPAAASVTNNSMSDM